MSARKFTVRYANWNPVHLEIPTKTLPEGSPPIEIVRHAMGTAFADHLKGYWKDADNIEVKLTKINPGVYIGERRFPNDRARKADAFYVMETT